MQPAAGFRDRRTKQGKKVGVKCGRCAKGRMGKAPSFVEGRAPRRLYPQQVKYLGERLSDWTQVGNSKNIFEEEFFERDPDS